MRRRRAEHPQRKRKPSQNLLSESKRRHPKEQGSNLQEQNVKLKKGDFSKKENDLLYYVFCFIL